MSRRLVIGQVATVSALTAVKFGASGRGSNGVTVIQASFPRFRSISDAAVARHADVENLERLAHFDLEIGDEAIRVERQLQRPIIRCALRLEVGREILVRVAISVGADDPDLLAPKLVAQGVQDTDLVGDPVDALPSPGIFFNDRFAPEALHDAVDRHDFFGRESLESCPGVTLQEIERLDDRAMVRIVRAEFQALEDFGHHAAVMTLVGIADHRSQRRPVARACGLGLPDQIAQGLFPDNREDDIAHDAVGLFEGGAGEVEQQVLLAGDAFQIVEQLALHPALGARADVMNGLDQKIGQVVRQHPAVQMPESGEPCEPGRLRMAAEFVGRLGCDPPPIALELMGKDAVKQIGRQSNSAGQLQSGQRLLNAGQAWLPRIAAQPQKQCRHHAGRRILGFVPGRAQQRLQPLSRRRGKAADDAGIKLLIVGAARGPDDAINAIGRRRLDQKLAASGLQKRGKLIRNRAYSCHLTAQPIFEPRRIGNARLAKARQSADFGTVSFGGPPRQARREARGSRDGELPRDLLDDRRIDLAGGSRKPSSVAEKHQQYGEAEPVLMMLGHDERQIRERQWRSLRGHSLVGDFQFGRGGCRGGRSYDSLQNPHSVKSAIVLAMKSAEFRW